MVTVHDTVWIVDADEENRAAATRFVRGARMQTRAYSHAAGSLGTFDPDLPGRVVLKVRIPGMNGLDVQNRLGQGAYCPPIAFVTTLRDVPTIVRTVKAGAFHLPGEARPESPLPRGHSAGGRSRPVRAGAHATHETLLKAWNRLSGRERQVLEKTRRRESFSRQRRCQDGLLDAGWARERAEE